MVKEDQSNWVFPIKERFKLSDGFVDKYKDKQPNWGPLGYITYKRSYSRVLENENRTEEWWETCKRVIEGCFTIQLNHCKNLRLPWDAWKAQKSAQEMFERMFLFKWMPPGRGLYSMGTDVIYKRGSMALFNCSNITSKNIKQNFSDPFVFMMEVSMNGVGCGFDLLGANQVKISEPKVGDYKHIVEDSAQGWCDILRITLDSFVGKCKYPKEVDYSQIRPAGSLIKTSGGYAPGPQVLIDCITDIYNFLTTKVDKLITSTDIVDLMNMIGKCVVAGGKRRCLPANTIIHTKDGLIPIKDVEIGQYVKTSDGWKKIVDRVYQGIQNIITIKTQLGEFRCTPQHRMKVYSTTQTFEFKCANELKSGDKMVFLNEMIDSENIMFLPKFKYTKPKHSTTCKDINIPELDDDLAWFFGNFHGDGTVGFYHDKYGNNIKASIAYATASNEIEVFNKFVNQLKRFGVNVGITDPKELDDCFRASCSSHQLAGYLYQFKRPYKSIQIPDFIMNSKNSIKKSYLSGLFDADGSYKNRPLNLCTSIYPEFLKQLQILYSSLGIATKIKPQNFKSRQKENWKPLYKLNVVGEKHVKRVIEIFEKYSKKFVKNLKKMDKSGYDYGFPSNWVIDENIKYWYKKWDKNTKQITECTLERVLEKTSNTTPIEVIEIINNRSDFDHTYDISVEDNHEFVCDTGYISHNTAQLALGEHSDLDYISMKNPELYSKELLTHRWASNNSVIGNKGMNYDNFVDQIAKNGEPGIIYLDALKNYGRLKDGRQEGIDDQVTSTNPCLSYDTNILVADGRGCVKIGEIEDNTPVFCLTDTGNIEIKPIRHPRITGYDVPTYKVSFNNGMEIICTNNHKFLTNEGFYTELVDLQIGSKIISFDCNNFKRIDYQKYDYDTFDKNNDIFVNKKCEICNKSFSTNFKNREISFCSTDCSNKYLEKNKNKIDNNFTNVIEISNISFYDNIDVWNGTVDNHHNFFIKDDTSDVVICNKQCGEIGLSGGNGSGGELCNLAELFPSLHENYEDFKRSIKYAYMYAKTVTLLPTSNEFTNTIILKNRRIGISMTGIVDAIVKHGTRNFFNWCDNGYKHIKELDKIYSDWLCIQKSIKLSTTKPAGSTSLLAGVSPGIHYPHSEYYIRRIRIAKHDPIIKNIKKAGYKIEDTKYNDNTFVVEVPVKSENFVKSKEDATLWEQLELGAKIQELWSDNSVSQTVTFKEHEKKDLKIALEMYEDRLKTVSFLPLTGHNYVQAPYETITKEQYEQMIKKIKPIDFSNINTHDVDSEEKFCEGDKCTLDFTKKV